MTVREKINNTLTEENIGRPKTRVVYILDQLDIDSLNELLAEDWQILSQVRDHIKGGVYYTIKRQY